MKTMDLTFYAPINVGGRGRADPGEFDIFMEANRITGRKIQGTLVGSVIPPDVINTYFQTINTDDE